MQPVFAPQPAPTHCVTCLHVLRARLSARPLPEGPSEVLFPVQGVRGQVQAGDVELPARAEPIGPAGEQGNAELRRGRLCKDFHV